MRARSKPDLASGLTDRSLDRTPAATVRPQARPVSGHSPVLARVRLTGSLTVQGSGNPSVAGVPGVMPKQNSWPVSKGASSSKFSYATPPGIAAPEAQ
jgi:hypothetical protein